MTSETPKPVSKIEQRKNDNSSEIKTNSILNEQRRDESNTGSLINQTKNSQKS